jgi:SAM-dependent methyltransferase
VTYEEGISGVTPEATLARLREYMVGPTRFMNLQACFELGLVDALAEAPAAGLTAAELGAVEQLLHLLVKERFVAFDEGPGRYTPGSLADLAEADLGRVRAFLTMLKTVMFRQLFHLADSVRTGAVVGLKELYGFDGDLFSALACIDELRDAWLGLAVIETESVYPWFFRSIDLPADARVLDVIGGNGFGAVMACRTTGSERMRVTTFDRPELESACLATYREADIDAQCDFVGGDPVASLPTGYDVVLIKHFLDIFDKSQVLAILRNAHASLAEGGSLVILAPVYPEDIRQADDYQADFFPSFILGCAMGRGGPQRVSTYQSWLEECGFKVTQVLAKDPADIPADAVITRVILCATKTS